MKKTSWDFNYLQIFAIPSSSRHEKNRQMLERRFSTTLETGTVSRGLHIGILSEICFFDQNSVWIFKKFSAPPQIVGVWRMSKEIFKGSVRILIKKKWLNSAKVWFASFRNNLCNTNKKIERQNKKIFFWPSWLAQCPICMSPLL